MRRLVIGVVVTVGAGLIVTGWLADPDSYLSSLLLELGATVLLVLPLLWIERVLERRVETSEARTRVRVDDVADEISGLSESVAETRQSLADVQEQLASRLQESANADRDLVTNARHDFSFDALDAVFQRAAELGSLSARGLRVAIAGQWERLRFRRVSEAEPEEPASHTQPLIWLSIEDPAGNDIGVSVVWRRDETIIDAMATLAEAWTRKGSYPGDSALDLERILERLLLSLEVAIQSRRTRGEAQFHPLIEMPSASWAMTDLGLENIPEDYYAIQASALVTIEELTHWRRHMQDKLWVKAQDELARATYDADFWMVSEVAHQYFAARAAEK